MKKNIALIMFAIAVLVLATCANPVSNQKGSDVPGETVQDEYRVIVSLNQSGDSLSEVQGRVTDYLQEHLAEGGTTRSTGSVSLVPVHDMSAKINDFMTRTGSTGLTDEQLADQVYEGMASAFEQAMYRDFMITVDESQVDEVKSILADHPDVAWVEDDTLHKLQYEPNDQYYTSGYLWGLNKTNCSQAWDVTQGENVIVAVIDSGVDGSHPDLEDNLWTNSQGTWGWDFSDNDAYPSPDGAHGTHVAGTIAAVGNNGRGVIGVAPNVTIMAVKIFPRAYSSVCANAIRYAVDNGAKVLNNSWGPQSRSVSDRTIENAIEYAHSKGAVIVFAAGNSNDDADYYHGGNHPKTISVGAVDSSFRKASFSNYGSTVDISAPGVTIYSTMPSNGYGQMSGTSMAAPHVAGLAALIMSRYPDYSNEKVRDVITGNAIPISHSQMGAGVMDAWASVEDGPRPPAPDPAVITGISDPVYANEDFTIYGTGFGTEANWGYIAGDNSVSESFQVVSWSDTEIVVENRYAAGDYQVWVWDAGLDQYTEPYTLAIVTRPQPEGYFNFQNRYTGLLMRPYNAGTENGTEVVQYEQMSWQSQQWQLVDLENGYHVIKNRYTSDILWVSDNSTSNNANIVMYQDVANPTQYQSIQWQVTDLGNGYYSIMNRLSGKYLRPYNAGTSNNTEIIQYEWRGYRSQQWKLDPVQ
jgi:thermitase